MDQCDQACWRRVVYCRLIAVRGAYEETLKLAVQTPGEVRLAGTSTEGFLKMVEYCDGNVGLAWPQILLLRIAAWWDFVEPVV